jgi:hypothetical protein
VVERDISIKTSHTRIAATNAAFRRASGYSDDQIRGGVLLGLAAQHAITSMAQGDNMPILVKVNFEKFATRATIGSAKDAVAFRSVGADMISMKLRMPMVIRNEHKV